MGGEDTSFDDALMKMIDNVSEGRGSDGMVCWCACVNSRSSKKAIVQWMMKTPLSTICLCKSLRKFRKKCFVRNGMWCVVKAVVKAVGKAVVT